MPLGVQPENRLPKAQVSSCRVYSLWCQVRIYRLTRDNVLICVLSNQKLLALFWAKEISIQFVAIKIFWFSFEQLIKMFMISGRSAPVSGARRASPSLLLSPIVLSGKLSGQRSYWWLIIGNILLATVDPQFLLIQLFQLGQVDSYMLLVKQVVEHKAGPKGCLVPCVELIEPESSGADRWLFLKARAKFILGQLHSCSSLGWVNSTSSWGHTAFQYLHWVLLTVSGWSSSAHISNLSIIESFRNLGHELVKLGLAEAMGDEAEVRLATRDNWGETNLRGEILELQWNIHHGLVTSFPYLLLGSL